MRRLLITVLIVGAFLGGYHLGRQPGSPDIFGWARRNYPEAAEAFRSAADSVFSEPAAGEAPYAEVSSQTR